MIFLHAAFGRLLRLAVLTSMLPACAWGSRSTLVRTAPGEEMAFDKVPTRDPRPTSIAMPAVAPCHLAGGSPDIVCALMTMDASYYAAMCGRGDASAPPDGQPATQTNDSSAGQMASDE